MSGTGRRQGQTLGMTRRDLARIGLGDPAAGKGSASWFPGSTSAPAGSNGVEWRSATEEDA